MSRLSKRITRWPPACARRAQKASSHATIWAPRPMMSSNGGASGSPKLSQASWTPLASVRRSTGCGAAVMGASGLLALQQLRDFVHVGLDALAHNVEGVGL